MNAEVTPATEHPLSIMYVAPLSQYQLNRLSAFEHGKFGTAACGRHKCTQYMASQLVSSRSALNAIHPVGGWSSVGISGSVIAKMNGPCESRVRVDVSGGTPIVDSIVAWLQVGTIVVKREDRGVKCCTVDDFQRERSFTRTNITYLRTSASERAQTANIRGVDVADSARSGPWTSMLTAKVEIADTAYLVGVAASRAMAIASRTEDNSSVRRDNLCSCVAVQTG